MWVNLPIQCFPATSTTGHPSSSEHPSTLLTASNLTPLKKSAQTEGEPTVNRQGHKSQDGWEPPQPSVGSMLERATDSNTGGTERTQELPGFYNGSCEWTGAQSRC